MKSTPAAKRKLVKPSRAPPKRPPVSPPAPSPPRIQNLTLAEPSASSPDTSSAKKAFKRNTSTNFEKLKTLREGEKENANVSNMPPRSVEKKKKTSVAKDKEAGAPKSKSKKGKAKSAAATDDGDVDMAPSVPSPSSSAAQSSFFASSPSPAKVFRQKLPTNESSSGGCSSNSKGSSGSKGDMLSKDILKQLAKEVPHTGASASKLDQTINSKGVPKPLGKDAKKCKFFLTNSGLTIIGDDMAKKEKDVNYYCSPGECTMTVPLEDRALLYDRPLIIRTAGWFDGKYRTDPKDKQIKHVVTTCEYMRNADSSTWNKKDKSGWPIFAARNEEVVPLDKVHKMQDPEVSFLLVRIAENMSSGDSNRIWTATGKLTGNEYVQAIFEKIVRRSLGTKYECFTMFVRDSQDLVKGADKVSAIVDKMRGKTKLGMYFVWPVMNGDNLIENDGSTQGFVYAPEFFELQRSLEAKGVMSAFPHPSSLYEFLIAKYWPSYWGSIPQLNIPATIAVSVQEIQTDPMRAARTALKSLDAMLSSNGKVVKSNGKAVVKLGYSWEAYGVWVLNAPDNPEKALAQKFQNAITSTYDFRAKHIFLQEFCDFDIEIRMWMLDYSPYSENGKDYPTPVPTRTTYNAWATTDSSGQKYDFTQYETPEEMLKSCATWQKDKRALNKAEAECQRLIGQLYRRLLSIDSEPAPFLRFDFMVKRTGPGLVKVMVGEMTEAGACPLFWKQGHELMFRSLLKRWIALPEYENVNKWGKRHRTRGKKKPAGSSAVSSSGRPAKKTKAKSNE